MAYTAAPVDVNPRALRVFTLFSSTVEYVLCRLCLQPVEQEVMLEETLNTPLLSKASSSTQPGDAVHLTGSAAADGRIGPDKQVWGLLLYALSTVCLATTMTLVKVLGIGSHTHLGHCFCSICKGAPQHSHASWKQNRGSYTLVLPCVDPPAVCLSTGRHGTPVFQILLIRVALMMLISISGALRQAESPFGNARVLLLLRGGLGCAASASYFWAVQLLPLADCVIITFLAPLFVAILAPLLLMEMPSRCFTSCSMPLHEQQPKYSSSALEAYPVTINASTMFGHVQYNLGR